VKTSEHSPGKSTASGRSINRDGDLEVLPTPAAVRRLTTYLLDQAKETPGTMRILEAGCGRKWELDLEVTEFEITGVDLDAKALEHRRTVTRDLDIGIVGTICDRDIVAPAHFDVVYSAYVLEHIDGAVTALDNFATWARPGGLIVMWLPNRNSVYGWTARHTPFWVHVWTYRYLFGQRNAGKPGYSPYPTYHDPVLAPGALRRYCEERGLIVEDLFAVDTFAGQRGAKYGAIRTGMRAVNLGSGGRLDDHAVDLGVVLRKPTSM
jgi:SAM-dependent methyltransferase